MKTLESQRALYLKSVEAAGNAKVLEVVHKLESELLLIKRKLCRKTLSEQYIRTGSFSDTFGTCSTQLIYCDSANHARIKEYFEQRNPNTIVVCFQGGACLAQLNPESLFQ